MHLTTFAQQNLDRADDAGQRRSLKKSARTGGIYVRRGHKSLISFSCNDYLGLSANPLVKQAALSAIEKYGTGGGASRLITGNNPLYAELESALAKARGTEAALVFGSGYLANIGIIPALTGRADLIVADKLSHASLLEGCKLSGAKLIRFTHNSLKSCEAILKKHRHKYRHCLLLTEHVFSMDGDLAPLGGLYELAEKYTAWLMSDDAHGLGVLMGNPGPKPHLQMGTLSKTAGSYGGYVCAAKTVIDYLTGAAKSLVYSTALPPATLAASLAALKIIANDKNLCAKPLENAILFTRLLGMPDAASPIVPLIISDAAKAVVAAQMLENNGYLVAAIRPPTVPRGASRLRFAFSALHKAEDIEKLAVIIKENALNE